MMKTQAIKNRTMSKKAGHLLCFVVIAVAFTGCLTPRQMTHNLNNWSPGYRPTTSANMAYQQQNATAALLYGVISGSRANIRSGPGTGNAVIASLTGGNRVRILTKQNNWYQIEANVNGITRRGWIYAPLIKTAVTQAAYSAAAANTRTPGPGLSNIVYMGYTKDFLPAKQLLASGQINVLSNRIVNTANKTGESTFWKQDDEFLRAIEYGTIALDGNNTEIAVKNLASAETILEERENSSQVGEWLQSGGGWLGEVFGNGALAPYQGTGYEKVLLLNYLSISYLLEGERKAYNVARRSIDLQNIEKKAFDARRKIAEEKLHEQDSSSKSARGGIDSVFDTFNVRAKDVPSAYVNPFGFYVTGMIQEYESYQDRSLRDNALISYKKALELNPRSEVIKQAVKELKKPSPPSGKQLLHVVVADGFVPEKKVLVYTFHSNGMTIPLKLPIYQPSNSQVGYIEIQTRKGKRLARLTPVADVEALCIRHQKDMEVFRNLRVALAFASTVVEKSFLRQLGAFGNLIGDYHDKYKQPDTRSWVTLPASIQAARVHLPGNISQVKLVSYSKTGRVLARQTVKLFHNKPNFIYARSIDQTLYAHVAKRLWIAGTS